MILCTLNSTFTIGDIVAIATAILTLLTVFLMYAGNKQNARQSQIQSIESTIIKQLEFHHDLVSRMKLNLEAIGGGYGAPSISPEILGSDTFEHYYEFLKNKYSELPLLNLGNNKVTSEEQRISEAFGEVYSMFGNQLGNYHKNLYLLFKYIDDKREIKGFDAKHYARLVKYQLSKYEILLLAYNCIWLQDKPKGERFIDLAKKYNILSALEINELIKSNNVLHQDIFEKRYHLDFG